MSLVVTGATGRLGRHVVAALSAQVPAESLAVVVRDRAKAADLSARGIHVRVADYDEPGTLRDAFEPGDRVLLISADEVGRRVPRHRNVVDAAARAGVALLAYTGVLGGPRADFLLAAEHKATERAILESKLPYTFLRNGWYHENYTEHLAPVLRDGYVLTSAGDGRLASAARADYAAAAAAVLTGEGHEGRAYELSGDAAWSFTEYAAEVGRATGRSIRCENVTPQEHLRRLAENGTPGPMSEVFVDVDGAIKRGLLSATPGHLSALIGRPTTPLSEAISAAVGRPGHLDTSGQPVS
ncbi:SDR family oxidoreductase [Streptomyces sp. NA04227]|uniref:SDR family oxidoreductase n=1 Tax=Streptomyces sp. NA04227 TaxID=2742136 RepID=UPI001590D107|nr:SDR family oxidoreductase [Streptomyces sp. NA04227]QKW08539.1 SDR family oxidoreductase [Streptomyces sp. NA04227]